MFPLIFGRNETFYVVISNSHLSEIDLKKISWLLEVPPFEQNHVEGIFIGPRNEFTSPFSTNSTEIFGRCELKNIIRLEKFSKVSSTDVLYDKMLETLYSPLIAEDFCLKSSEIGSEIIIDIREFSQEKGLALSPQEIDFLKSQSIELGRDLTDVEIYAFSQINSEHCRHKIFNGNFTIDSKLKGKSLFDLIKQTTKNAPTNIVSAYKDNVAFFKGPKVSRFLARENSTGEYLFSEEEQEIVFSLKAETHNFPTTVEPFNGASTGSGGEIRDRMAGGKASIPLAGNAVYMTSFTRLNGSDLKKWESQVKERPWKYQTPSQILIKASNGASDFGNKFGQPLINGSVLTLESKNKSTIYAYDRVVMLAGGIGFARSEDALKNDPDNGDMLILLGGDNYRIGMAGGSVSSVDTGVLSSDLELSAIQRANPEMQKRVFNVVRTLSEKSLNPIKLIHDHGSGGHINCFTELLESLGGEIWLDELPLGDRTLSPLELLCNESQERMGLVISESDVELLKKISDREGAPCYVVGKITGSGRITALSKKHKNTFDLPVTTLIGNSPKLNLSDSTIVAEKESLEIAITNETEFNLHLKDVLSLEAVACKDWLTNKVDRSVSGLVAQQQCAGPFHLPLNDCGVMAVSYDGKTGIASSIGHAPAIGILKPSLGATMSVVEALSNIVGAPLAKGLSGISLSANWMWPAKQEGEDARLYEAVEALSNFCQAIDIPVPTGKDSLSMTMRYGSESPYPVVRSPGTVVVSAAAETTEVFKCVSSDLKDKPGSLLLAVDFTGSSKDFLAGSALSQILMRSGNDLQDFEFDTDYIKRSFNFIQNLIHSGRILAIHDVSAGGLIVAAIEMAIVGDVGLTLNLSNLTRPELSFSEKPKILIQIEARDLEDIKLRANTDAIKFDVVGDVGGAAFRAKVGNLSLNYTLELLRANWINTSYQLDKLQTNTPDARSRYLNLPNHKMKFESVAAVMPDEIVKLKKSYPKNVSAIVLREKGSNGDRELSYALHTAGFRVTDVTMDDLISERASLENAQFLAFPGGFSNSDVLGAGRGWAAAFQYNKIAKNQLEKFYDREDTLSIGVCNGCQLMTAFGLIDRKSAPGISMSRNNSKKFESTFVPLKIEQSSSVLLRPLADQTIGAWIAHGEGKFNLDSSKSTFEISAKYLIDSYPMNPNGSDFSAAAINSVDGRHLAIMPHIERSFLLWQWPFLPLGVSRDKFSPWIESFLAAKGWFEGK